MTVKTNIQAGPARACGMEAEEEPQHRAKAKPRKAGMSGQACSSTRRPISSRDMTVLRTGAAGSHSSFRETFRVHGSGSVEGGNDNDAIPGKKSDLARFH